METNFLVVIIHKNITLQKQNYCKLLYHKILYTKLKEKKSKTLYISHGFLFLHCEQYLISHIH